MAPWAWLWCILANPSPQYKVDRDFVIMLSEWAIKPGTSRPDPNAMRDFSVLTMNARAFPGTAPLVATWLISSTGDMAAPAFYLMFLSAVSIVALLTLRLREGGPLP